MISACSVQYMTWQMYKLYIQFLSQDCRYRKAKLARGNTQQRTPIAEFKLTMSMEQIGRKTSYLKGSWLHTDKSGNKPTN